MFKRERVRVTKASLWRIKFMMALPQFLGMFFDSLTGGPCYLDHSSKGLQESSESLSTIFLRFCLLVLSSLFDFSSSCEDRVEFCSLSSLVGGSWGGANWVGSEGMRFARQSMSSALQMSCWLSKLESSTNWLVKWLKWQRKMGVGQARRGSWVWEVDVDCESARLLA